MPKKDLHEIQCVCTNIKMASRVISRAYDKALESLNLTSTQYSILTNIQKHQPIPQMQLAQHLDLERTSLYRAVAIMEKKGWLKTTAMDNGVAKDLQLTSSGEKLVIQAQKKWAPVHQQFTLEFGKKRWADFQITLTELKNKFL